jgi:Predicted phosphatase/phosphohexomutase
MPRSETAFLFDLDGTLVDSVYQHVLAWKEALDQEGIPLSVWRIHRKIGMSGGLFANALLRETGREVTDQQAGELRACTPRRTPNVLPRSDPAGRARAA